MEHDVEVCVEYKVPMIITSLRAPKFVVDAVHSYGGVVMHDVINIRHAKKAIDEGADGLILVCAGAGGHAGTLSPFALVSEVREFFDGPLHYQDQYLKVPLCYQLRQWVPILPMLAPGLLLLKKQMLQKDINK